MKPLFAMKKFLRAMPGLLALFAPVLACADGLVMDKVYHPYVDALEKELEFRSVFQDPQPGISNKAQLHQLAVGTALSDSVFAEFYVIGGKDRASGFETEAWEAEVKWQLSEPGEYWADYGILFEYENEIHMKIEEATVGFLAEKELGSWSAAANLFVIREWGDDILDEYETSVAFQARYRLKPEFEPAIEVYAGQNARGIGPVLQGTFATGVRKSLHWEAGLLFGLGNKSPNQTWRLLFEYEF